MLMLGISTSSKYPSAAVMKKEGSDSEILSFLIGTELKKSHSEVLMSLIEQALSEADADKTDVDAVCVDAGPGSFTGVRIGVSCANAIAFALGIPVIPVCSLNALCAERASCGTEAAMIDCRNGNCYAAVFEDGEQRLAPSAQVSKKVLDSLPEDTVIRGDLFNKDLSAYPNARLVLIEAAKGLTEPVAQAVPMYLRPSQAERMNSQKD